MKRYKLTIEYDGTDFAGWQRQADCMSVQQALEEALAKLYGQEVLTHAAGRTDSGVHALAQVAHFETDKEYTLDEIEGALNFHLKPHTVVIEQVEEMDADFQHNPTDIPRFLKEAEKGGQFIIGSRYVAGGDIPSWSFKRKMYSWGANVLARKIAGIGEVNDCTSGFRCIDATLFKSFDLNDIKANGYAFQLNILHVAVKRKLVIKN